MNAMNQLKAKQQASGIFLKGKPFVKKGRHLTEISGIPIVIYDNYQVIKRVGDGAYGVVFKAVDRSKNNELVAIKKMSDAFRDPRDAKRILREIKLLKFCDHPNIIKLKDIVKPESMTGYRDIYLVLEFMEIDLDKTINSEQLLNGIYYMHSADIIHRDIKPSNILLLKNCTLKLADMNLARKFDLDERITEYVVTRPYRAPEILLSSQNYSKPIDIWSAGCIFAEMMGRKTIFKGTSYLNQLDRIVAIIGKPDFDKLSYKVDDSLREYIGNFSDKQPENFYEIYKSHDKLAIDLLYKMLAFDPKERWTVDQCLHHQYFASFSKANLKACDVKFDWSFDEIAERNDVIQRAIYNESCAFHADEPDAPAEEIELHYKQQQQMILAQHQQLLAQKQMQMMMQQKQQQQQGAAAPGQFPPPSLMKPDMLLPQQAHAFGKNPAEFQMHIEKLMAQQQLQKQQMMAMNFGATDPSVAMQSRPTGGPPGTVGAPNIATAAAAAAAGGASGAIAAAAFGNLMNFRPNSMPNHLPMFPHFNPMQPSQSQSSQLPQQQSQLPAGMPPNGMMQHMFMQNLSHMQAAAAMPLQKDFGNPFAPKARKPELSNPASLPTSGWPTAPILSTAAAPTAQSSANGNNNNNNNTSSLAPVESGTTQDVNEVSPEEKNENGMKQPNGVSLNEQTNSEEAKSNNGPSGAKQTEPTTQPAELAEIDLLQLKKEGESNDSLPILQPIRVKMHTFGSEIPESSNQQPEQQVSRQQQSQ